MINRTQDEIMHDWGENIETPLVSINCITYNHEAYIAQTLDGFLMQKTNFPFEILINEDASTDRTAEIIKQYEKKFPQIIKPIYQKINQYSQKVDVFGINNKRAKGKYIAFCEGDDYWTAPNKLQMQVDWLEAHPEYTMHFHRSELIYETNYPCGLECNSIENRDYSATELFENWIVPTASICIRKACLFHPIKHAENILNGDIFIVEKAAHLGKVRGCAKKMAAYRIHATGVTYDPKIQKKRIFAYPKHFSVIKENFPLIEASVINKKLINSCMHAFSTFGYKIEWIKIAFFTSPKLFIKVFLFNGVQNSYRLILQKKYKDALFSLPIFRIIVPIIYYNILKKQ